MVVEAAAVAVTHRRRRRPPSDPDLRSLCQVTSGTGTGATAEANVRKFVEAGGVVVAAGSAAESIAQTLQLPVTDYMIERQPGQPERALSSDKFYVPGLDRPRRGRYRRRRRRPAPRSSIDVFFNNSPVFRLQPNAAARGDPAGDVVRLGDAAAQRLGVGPELSRGRHHRVRGDGWARARRSCSDRRSRSARSRTARSSSCSTRSSPAAAGPRRKDDRGALARGPLFVGRCSLFVVRKSGNL